MGTLLGLLLIISLIRAFAFVVSISSTDETLSSWQNIKNWLKSL